MDRLGRLHLPVWLRRLTEPTGSAFVATGWSDRSSVLLTAPTLLDGLVDDLAASAR